MTDTAIHCRKPILNKSLLLALCLFLSFLASSCTSLQQKPEAIEPSSQEAVALLNKLQKRNAGMLSFKGTGRMRLENHNGTQRARILWAALGNEKIRIELMGPSGRSLVSFSHDGEKIYLISHTENRFYTKKRQDASLEKLIEIPIRVRVALDLLAGRLPADVYRAARLQESGPQGGKSLILSKRDGGEGYDRVFVDGATDFIITFESFDAKGRLKYRVGFDDGQNISGFLIPGKLVFSDGQTVNMEITIERIWPNARVEGSMFVLKRPK